MGNKKFKTALRYRGSRDGWMNADFHRMSDGIGPTMTLFKIKENGKCIGGFTSAQWSSPDKATYVKDSTAMLTNFYIFWECKNHELAIRCNKNGGPYFGVTELKAEEPFNGDKKCSSYNDRDGYHISSHDHKQFLTGLKCKGFIINERS